MPKGVHNGTRGPQRSLAERLADRVVIMKMLRRGATKQEICRKLGLNWGRVHHDWKVLLKDLSEQRAKDIEYHRAALLEQLAEIKKEAWDAWESSKQDAVRETTTTPFDLFDPSPEPTKKVKKTGLAAALPEMPPKEGTRTVVRAGQTGDSKYLTLIKSCVESEIELQGLKIAPANTINLQNNVNNIAVDWTGLLNGLAEISNGQDPIERQISEGLLIESKPAATKPQDKTDKS